jgi:DNA-binding FadR family transcriptional regulator
LKSAAARLATTRRTDGELTDLNEALAAMRRDTLATEAGQAADRNLHDALLRATQNDALATLRASIGAAVSWTTRFKQRARALPRNPTPDHARVVDAVSSGDAAAAESAMRHLLDLGFNDTCASLPAQSVGNDRIS